MVCLIVVIVYLFLFWGKKNCCKNSMFRKTAPAWVFFRHLNISKISFELVFRSFVLQPFFYGLIF